MIRLPEIPDLVVIDPGAAPAMDRVGDVAYCRRCGTRLGVDCPGLAGVVPPPEPHRSPSDCRSDGVVSA